MRALPLPIASLLFFATAQVVAAQTGGPISISPSTLLDGTVGQLYSQQLTASGGSPPYAWTIQPPGSQPPGLTISSNGVLSGTPLQPGNFLFSIQATDSSGGYGFNSYNLIITPALAIVAVPTPPNGVVGLTYGALPGGGQFKFQAMNGTPPYTWSPGPSLQGDTSFPPGLSLSTDGTFAGTPTQSGTFYFHVTVADSAKTPTQAVGGFAIYIANGLTIATTTIPDAEVNLLYSTTFIAQGGNPPYQWALQSGGPPSSLKLDPRNANLFGTPQAGSAGTYTFSLQVTDTTVVSGSTPNTATATLSLTIYDLLSITTGPTLPPGAVGSLYSQSIGETGGKPPYKWSVQCTPQNFGLQIDSQGNLSGTPNSAGNFNCAVTVNDVLGGTSKQTFTIVVTNLPTIPTASPLAKGSVAAQYSQQLLCTGGAGQPYTWSTPTGAPPPGLNLNPGGLLSGAPTTQGTFTFSPTCKDSAGNTVSKSLTVQIAAQLTITTTSLPQGVLNTPYPPNTSVASSGGNPPPLTWSASGLPSGLTLDAGTGLLHGTSTPSGSFNPTFTVKDNFGASASKTLPLVIANTVSFSPQPPSVLPVGFAGSAYRYQASAGGGLPPYSWSLTSPPSGMTIDSSGVLAWANPACGSYSIGIKVSDQTGASPPIANTSVLIGPASIVISGLTNAPLTQPRISVSIPAACNTALTGQLNLNFQQQATNGGNDLTVKLETGNSASFAIPANNTKAVFGSNADIGLQTGTVAGTISLSATLASGTTTVTPSQNSASTSINKAAPTLTQLSVSRSGSALTVTVQGYSTTRDMSSATFTFSGSNLQTTQFNVSLTSLSNNWYVSQTGTAANFGSQFIYSQTFNVTQGDATAVTAVDVTMSNSQPGSSNKLSGSF